MNSMTETPVRPTEPLTVVDLEAMGDDGRRRELIDGTLVVTPGPEFGHQQVSMELIRVLLPLVPGHLVLLHAPFDVRVGPTTSLQPDLLVAPRGDFAVRSLPVAPLLAVEILSPSTRHLDRGLKKSKYEELGTAHYWIVDPAAPSMTAWELVDGRYVEAGHAEGDATLVLERPFPVSIVSSGLIT